MDIYTLTKVVHILSATVLFGTGLGTAFFMLRGHAATDIRIKYELARSVVLADFIFTLPAVIIQPVSGMLLIDLAGHDGTETWLLIAYGLYGVAGLCWLPVVWIQIKVMRMLKRCLHTGHALPRHYHHLFRI